MATILALETKKYAITIQNFQGPLDILCHLIDSNKMNIYDIKISEIADQYIAYLNEMEKINLEIASEFLVMASTLLYLKSKKLLPKQENEEEEITEEELIRRIIDYKKYKEISKILKEEYQKCGNRIFKKQEEIKLPKQKIENKQAREKIPSVYMKLIEKNKQKINENARNIERIAITEIYTVGSKVKEMFKILIKQKKFIFNKLFSIDKHNKKEIVTAFTGLLEMSRRNKIQTNQESIFGDIVVKKYKKLINN